MIRSKKLYLSKLTIADLELYKSIYMDEKLTRYVCPVLNSAQVHKCFNQSLHQSQKINPDYVVYIIRLKLNDEPVGVIGLRWNQSSKNTVEIGIIITSDHQRFGYAHEAKNSLIQYSFTHLNVDEVIALCEKENVAANAANIKLGFEKHKETLNKKNKKYSIVWQKSKGENNE